MDGHQDGKDGPYNGHQDGSDNYLQGLGRHQVNLDGGQQGVTFRMGLWVFPADNIDQNPIN